MHDDMQTLFEKARAGDAESFQILIGRYDTELEAVIRLRLGEPLRRRLSVDDVRQETLLRAFRAMDRFEWKGDTSFFRWLSGIAVRVILEAAKDQRRERPISLDFDVFSKEASPSRTLARKERLQRFEAALKILPPDYAEVLRLVRIEGRSVTEAAERMNRTPNAVSHLLLRALRKLRDRFGDTESFTLEEETSGDQASKDRGRNDEAQSES